jgi:hypothetical protein
MDKPVNKVTSFKKNLPQPPQPANPTPTAQARVPNLGLMRPGTVLTDIEKEGLKSLGIVEDPSKLPANIAEKIQKTMGDKAPQLGAQASPLHIPEPVDIKDLSEEKRKELIDFINQTNDISAAAAKRATGNDPLDYSTEELERINPQVFKKPVIIDDLGDAPANKPPPPDKKEEKASPAMDAGLLSANAVNNCPHCGWDVNKSELVEIAENDKFDFVQSILGGKRFKKVYEIFGGALRITFRTLTTAESDMAYKQIILDAQNDVQSKIIGDTSFYWKTLMAYRCIMAVEKIDSSQGVTEIPPISEIEADAEKASDLRNTKVAALFDDMVEQIMPTELMRNTVTHIYTEFQSLCEKLQVMAESKDFWNAIQ